MRGSIKGRHRKRFISVPVPKLHSCGSNPTSGGTNFPGGAQSFSSPAKKQIAAEQEAYAYTIRAVARANASCAGLRHRMGAPARATSALRRSTTNRRRVFLPAQFVEQCLGLLVIGGAEALPEPTVDGGEEIVSLRLSASLGAEAR